MSEAETGLPHADQTEHWRVLATEDGYRGYVIGLRHDTVEGPDGGSFRRDVITHLGAVGVLAVDAQDRVLVVRQYRHPMGRVMVELVAGLRDAEGEPAIETAKRELAEEGHLQASRWTRLFDMALSPGVSDEVLTLFLAEDVTPAPVPEGFVAHDEESSMTRAWVPLADVVDAVLDGRVANVAFIAGVLALYALRSRQPRCHDGR